MRRSRAIVTLTLGESIRHYWECYCRANWEHYAARHDAEVIVFRAPLDDSVRAQARQASWQKLLVLGQAPVRAYEQVVWMDADILIHPQAAWVGETVPAEQVGATDEYAYPTPDLNAIALSQLCALWEKFGISFERNGTAREFYTVAGFDPSFDRAVQAGVMVVSPRHHREIFESVYYGYEQRQDLNALRTEMRPLSYELVRQNLVTWLDPRWNASWVIEEILNYPFLFLDTNHPLLARCTTHALSQNFFLHFAGTPEMLANVDLNDPQLSAPPPPLPRYISAPPANSAPPHCTSPVALILFNRPATTARVLGAVRAVRPSELYLIADGPRAEHPDDAALCQAAREQALQVDWECEVKTNFAETNLGLKARVESGLDWLFTHVPEAIILEDDCLPDLTFFRFCDEMLERYRDDPRIMAVSGCNYKFGLAPTDSSYSFSRYPLIWGWATWRRAWQLNDPDMKTLPDALAQHRLRDLFDDSYAVQYWSFILNDFNKTRTTWDYPWVWSVWQHGGLCIHPNTNLVANVGFGAQATHTREQDNLLSNLVSSPMPFPLQHPHTVERDVDADALIEEVAFSGSVRRLWKTVRQRRGQDSAVKRQ